MDLDIENTLTVSVATFLLLPILWIKVQRSKRIQPEYKRGITIGLILFSALVVLCTKAYTEYEYYTDIFQLATLLVCVLLFMLATKACWRERMYKLGIMVTVAVIMLAFVAIFARESSPNYSQESISPPLPDLPPMPTYSRETRPPPPPQPPKVTDMSMPKPMPMSMPSEPLVNNLIYGKSFYIKKIGSKVSFIVFAALCFCYGV